MVLIGLLVVPSAAEIIFVPDSISTIQAAIDSAATGDTIIVAQGLYKENLNLYDKNIVLASNFLLDPAAEHILNTIINGDSAGNVVRIDGDAKLIGFTLTNGYDINGHGAAILCEHPFSDELPPVKPEFRNLVLTGNHGNTGNIYFLYVDAIITNVAIVNNAGTGISISDHGKAIVTNVTAYNDPWTDGTDFSLVPVGFSNVIVINSILSNIYTSTAELILYNTRVGTIWNEWVDGGGNIFADPSFIDSITYALTDSSPCIGAGLDSVLVGDLWYHAPAIDLLGNPRPAPGFSKPDMGAYENELSIPLIAKIYIPNFTISFDSTLVDSTSMKNLTVYNQGIVELKIDSIYTDNEQFQVENFSSIIPAGDSTTLMIHFVPTQQGEISGFLVIQSNDPLRPTVNINLRGTGKTPSSIDINNQKVPLTFSLKQCYPNPFNPLTTIEYSLAQKSEVELIIFNTLAQQIRTLVSRFQNAGNYTIVWDGTDQQGLMVSSGIYIYRIKAGTFSSSKKMSFLR
jgi:hypothetical protein